METDFDPKKNTCRMLSKRIQRLFKYIFWISHHRQEIQFYFMFTILTNHYQCSLGNDIYGLEIDVMTEYCDLVLLRKRINQKQTELLDAKKSRDEKRKVYMKEVMEKLDMLRKQYIETNLELSNIPKSILPFSVSSMQAIVEYDKKAVVLRQRISSLIQETERLYLIWLHNDVPIHLLITPKMYQIQRTLSAERTHFNKCCADFNARLEVCHKIRGVSVIPLLDNNTIVELAISSPLKRLLRRKKMP